MGFTPVNLNAQAAITRANARTSYPTGLCLEFVDVMFQKPPSDHQVLGGAAYRTAKIAADYVPGNRRFGLADARVGMVAFFSNGNAAGHIAIINGVSTVRSTDKPTSGRVATVTIEEIIHSWGGRPFRFATDWLMGHNIVNLGARLGGAAPAGGTTPVGIRISVPGVTLSAVQARVVAHGFSVGPTGIDGRNGPNTAAGVGAAQAAAGLVVDHNVGPKTWAWLSAAPVAAGGKHPQIQRGSKGEAVKQWQNYLKTHFPLYASRLTVDGDFGADTEAKTKEWQRRSGLVPDGVVGVKSWAHSGL